MVAFEITTAINKLADLKKMKGDLTNLRLSQASLGIVIVPKEMFKRNPPYGWKNFVSRMDDYLENLKKIASPMNVEIWDVDQVFTCAQKLRSK